MGAIMNIFNKTTKNGRVKLEYSNWWMEDVYLIYARPEQLEPYFGKYGDFFLQDFLVMLDSYRQCAFVKHMPLDNVRVVKHTKPECEQAGAKRPEAKYLDDELIMGRLANARKQVLDDRETRRKRGKIVGFRV